MDSTYGIEMYLQLPCNYKDHWQRVNALGTSSMQTLEELLSRMRSYSDVSGLRGLEMALKAKNSTVNNADFFTFVLPAIIRRALSLPALTAKRLENGEGPIPILQQGVRGQVTLKRDLVASLLANMFLCTFDAVTQQTDKAPSGYDVSNFRDDQYPDVSFAHLLDQPFQQEVAKLQMFLNYFRRISDISLIPGVIVVSRVVGVALNKEQWLTSSQPLLPLEMAPEKVGFETCPELAHADFANMYIGGGVLCGGCVQEEIRFSICPELCVSMLLCPAMLEQEAIQVFGAEQFSSYQGYAFSLSFGGDYVDDAARAHDGSVQSLILAMDALDFRWGQDSSLHAQMSSKLALRELNKALAAFTPLDEASLKQFPIIATGNWGCGAFLGFAPLKALLQWAAASQVGRQLRYFPFEQHFGPELSELACKAVAVHVSVGSLLRLLFALRPEETLFDLTLPGTETDTVASNEGKRLSDVGMTDFDRARAELSHTSHDLLVHVSKFLLMPTSSTD